MDVIRRDDLDLGLKLLTGEPEGGQNATEEQVQKWLNQRHKLKPGDRRFRNYQTHFLLDWTDPDIQEPLYTHRDLDLQLVAFPEVESPYKFVESVYKRNTKPLSASGWIPVGEEEYPAAWDDDRFIVKPPLFNEDLELINKTVEIRKLSYQVPLPSGITYNFYPDKSISTHFGIRLYSDSSPSGEIPVRCVTHGVIHNVTGSGEMKSGTKLMCAPVEWMQQQHPNRVYGRDMYQHLHDALGIGIELYQYDDPHWMWYYWGDDGDDYRQAFERMYQHDRIPTRGQGYAMTLEDVPGMSLGGNRGKIWIDPAYLNSVSKVNFHRMFREVNHCYKSDKCNYCGTGGQVYKIGDVTNGGYNVNKYAGLDGSGRYCRYRQTSADVSWQSRYTDNLDWDYYCKYVGIPQRAYEYDRHYRDLINQILTHFRAEGIFYWTTRYPNKFIEQATGAPNRYIFMNSLEINNLDFGQYRYFGTYNNLTNNATVIPPGQPIFYYTVGKPTAQEGTPEYTQQLTAHKASRIFARIWQYNDITSAFEMWLVELKDDYVSPIIRLTEFEVADDFEYGDNPFIKDKRYAGRNNGGYRDFMVKNPFTGQWEPSTEPYELAPDGFYNLEGGTVMISGTEHDIMTDIYAIMAGQESSSLPSPVYIDDVPPVVAQGRIKAWGHPGEVLTRNVVCWKQPVVVRWLHIQEIRDRLMSPTDRASDLPSIMTATTSGEPPKMTGEKVIPQPNHILRGNVEGSGLRKITGTGMVSNGDTPYSDIILVSDILHARNMVVPMLSYKLVPYLPNDYAEDFDDTIQCIMSRLTEPHHLTVQRYGYREPGIYCFMRNFKNGAIMLDDKFYTLYIPASIPLYGSLAENVIGDSPGGNNRILRVFHPNGMKWWKDRGLLGAGIQWGTPGPVEGYVANSVRFNEGNGFKQEGMAIVNLFRRNVPLDKEVVAAYLRLVPTFALEMGSSVVRTAGGGVQNTVGNSGFVNVDFEDPAYTEMLQRIDKSTFEGQVQYEAYIYWKEEYSRYHEGDPQYVPFTYDEVAAFGEAYENTKFFMGEYNFEYQNNFFEDNNKHKVTKPPGTGDREFFTWKRWDIEKTKDGNTLSDLVVSVGAPNIGGKETTAQLATGQRSMHWYKDVYTDLIRGLHSKTNVDGLNNRLDYDETGNIDSSGAGGAEPDSGRGYGFACSSGGWAKDWRVFDITDIVRLAYAQDRFDAKYYSVSDKTVSDHELMTLSALTYTDKVQELNNATLADRVVYYSGQNTNELTNLLVYSDVSPSSEATGRSADNVICIDLCLKQLLKPKDANETSDDIILPPTEDKFKKNYIVKKITIKVRGGIPYTPDPQLPQAEQVKMNPNFLLVLGKSHNPELGRVQSGWRYITSTKLEPANENTEKEHIFEVPEGLIQQYRFIRVITTAHAIKKLCIEGKYLRDDPRIAPITSPPLSEIHSSNSVIQERIHNSKYGAPAYTLIPIKHPISKVYEVLIHTNQAGSSNTKIRTALGGCIKLDYGGEFTLANIPKFTWKFDAATQAYYIDSGKYMFSRAMNALVIPALSYYSLSDSAETIIATLTDWDISIQYNSGRGSVARILIEAEKKGPMYDVDPEAICEITPAGVSKLVDPTALNPTFYGSHDQLIPYSVTNPCELQGGYVRGTMPETGHAFFAGSSIQTPKDLEVTAWKTKCKGIAHVYGECDVEIVSRVEFMAPAFVTHYDPVTGQPLSAGFRNTSGISGDTKRPNGGRKPASIYVNLMIGGSAFQNPSGNANDTVFRKKQVAFSPEVQVFLRERVDFMELGTTTWHLKFE